MIYLTKLIIATAVAAALQPCTASVMPDVPKGTDLPESCVGDGNESKDDASVKEYEEWIHALMYRRERAVKAYNAYKYGRPVDRLDDSAELLKEILEIDAKVKELRDKLTRMKPGKGNGHD